MSGLGVHYALPLEQAAHIKRAVGRDAKLLDLIDEIDEAAELDDEWIHDSEADWRPIHRCLTDGRLEHGDTPLHKCVLGSRNLYAGDEYFVNLLTPDEAREVASALANVDRETFRRGHAAIDPATLADEPAAVDFERVWDAFVALRGFFERASAAGRAVLFTADR